METFCAMVKLVQTKSQEDRAKKEDFEETEEAIRHDTGPEESEIKKSKLQQWALGVKRTFQISNGSCLIDPNYVCKSDLVLEKQEYVLASSKHYLLCHIFRFFGWICAIG